MLTTFVISATTAAVLVTSALASNCNPSYNVPTSGECYTSCNIKAGENYVHGWTMDHTSELFIESLSIMCNKTGPNYIKFMTTAGMCMAACKDSNPDDFNNEFAGACAWWNVHKNDTCNSKAVTATIKRSSISCQTGYRGKKRGNGPKEACCSSTKDCQKTCNKGRCE
ncbi:hypothetical protein G6F37_010472 [Rhizopus arrhizus]|nr:hypothetical protein G6F38_010514 [Rhizopus arrhizus]KAG1153307.1 hypothetical protein G6F37_010472 [Rhizopus arrhizus]